MSSVGKLDTGLLTHNSYPLTNLAHYISKKLWYLHFFQNLQSEVSNGMLYAKKTPPINPPSCQSGFMEQVWLAWLRQSGHPQLGGYYQTKILVSLSLAAITCTPSCQLDHSTAHTHTLHNLTSHPSSSACLFLAFFFSQLLSIVASTSNSNGAVISTLSPLPVTTLTLTHRHHQLLQPTDSLPISPPSCLEDPLSAHQLHYLR